MIKSLFILLFLFTLGLLIIPGVTYACGKGSKKPNHQKTEKSITQEPVAKKHSCQQDPCKTDHSKQEGCGSNCNHPNCTCLHFSITIALPLENALDTKSFNFPDQKKRITDTQINLSSGFHSIWQPPRIS